MKMWLRNCGQDAIVDCGLHDNKNDSETADLKKIVPQITAYGVVETVAEINT